jgi:uncharacterized metal-binding protein YceD (DUF177 family)
MKIHLRQIPVEGLHLSGEETCAIQNLDSDDVQCAGPLRYELDAGVSDGALWVKGKLMQPVELRCVRCLESFPFEIEVKDFAIHSELTGPEEIDLAPYVREDLLLTLPAHPHCDREGGRICPVPVGRAGTEGDENEKRRATDWSALDELKIRES